jgi:hypothetical protein
VLPMVNPPWRPVAGATIDKKPDPSKKHMTGHSRQRVIWINFPYVFDLQFMGSSFTAEAPSQSY